MVLKAAEAERHIVGALMRDVITASKLVSRLTPEDFTSLDCRRAFCAAMDMARAHERMDLLTLVAKIDGMYGAGSAKDVFLIECMSRCPGVVLCNEYAKIILEASARRKLLALSDKMAKHARDTTVEVADTVSTAQNALRGMLDTDNAGWTDIADVMLSAYEDCELRAKGEKAPILTGITPLDKVTGGIWPGEMTVIAARPSVGKSAFGMQVAINAALDASKKVCFVSAEMVDVQLGQRLIAKAARMKATKLRQASFAPEDFDTMASALNIYGHFPVSFLFATKHIEDICAEVTRKYDLGECDMLVVDYLQLLRTRKQFSEDRLRVGYISQMLKSLTTELKIPVVALAQVRRQNNAGRAKMPVLDDIRDSGAIEQDADNVIFLHRPDGPDDPTIHADHASLFKNFCQNGDMQYIVLNVAKQRQGQVGIIPVLFDGARMTYRAIDMRIA